MEVSSTTNNNTQATEIGKDPINKAIEVQEQQVLKTLEGLEEQAREMNAQKTGMGKNINITG